MFLLVITGFFYNGFGSVTEDIFESSRDTKPNVIIIDIDRMTRERMNCYDHYRNTTPNMCDFGKRNIFFEDAVSQSGWTASSVASILTSQYPKVHGVIDHEDRLSEDKTTMTEVLRKENYTTAAFPAYADKDASGLPEMYNLDQGFQKYQFGNNQLRAQIEDLDNWFNQSHQKPYFLYIQSFDPHGYNIWDSPFKVREFRKKYPRPKIQNTSFARPHNIRLVNGTYRVKGKNGTEIKLTDLEVRYIKAQYDDILRSIDNDFQNLIQILKAEGVYSNSIIIVTANHGEMVDTRTMRDKLRFTHGKVYDDNINVPLMMKLPENISKNVEKQVSLIDLYPTIMEEIGSEREIENKQGESLTPLYRNEGSYDSEVAFSLSFPGDIHSVRNGTWKFIRKRGGNELYNLERDPEEHRNVIDEYPKITEKMFKHMEEHRLENRFLKSN